MEKATHIKLPFLHKFDDKVDSIVIPIDAIEEYKYTIEEADTSNVQTKFRNLGFRYREDTKEYRKEVPSRYSGAESETEIVYHIPTLTLTRKALNGRVNGGTIYNGGGHPVGWALHGESKELYSISIVGKLAVEVYEFLQTVQNVADFTKRRVKKQEDISSCNICGSSVIIEETGHLIHTHKSSCKYVRSEKE